MNEKTYDVLIQTAAFLKMIAQGYIQAPAHAKTEAAELLDRIGAVLSESDAQEGHP